MSAVVNQNSFNARLIGLSAAVVVGWGITAWLRMVAGDVPPLELTGLAMMCAALVSRLLPGTSGAFTRAPRTHPWFAWLFISGGLVGGAAFYFAALARAPAAQVVVITYTWPLLFALASDVYSRRRPSVLTFVSLALGLAGVAVMQGWTQLPAWQAWFGYLGGLLAGLSWVGYSLFVQVYTRSVEPDYPAFFAVAGLIALGSQAALGGLVWPDSPATWIAIVALGAGPYGLGFVAWGHVVRHGNPRVVPVLPYAVPGVAAITLVLVGDTRPTLSLFVGCLLTAAACTTATRQRADSSRT